ncbi:MAG: AAA family ATPase, partial [Phoenicibacter congonensis]|nr:AAA family ATPase [Phoenicibacter congonensis]
DAQYQQDIRDLGQFQSTYVQETAEIVRVLKANMDDVMATIDLKAYQERLALLESSFEINRQRIAEKVKEPSKTVSLEDTDTLLLEIGAMIDEINKLVKANNDVIAEKRSSKNRCKIEILQFFASLLAADVKSYRDEVSRLNKELDAITARGQQLRKDLTTLNTEISELNKHNANTEAAIDSINKILRDSGFQGFSLHAKDGVENVYEVIREDGSVAENLSEGERNFIAFLYFYHQVRGSMTSEELKEKIVVIDDPVSSMDSTALFLVSAIVREMINVCRNNTEYLNPKVPGDYIKQLFILTHNVYFHREITYKQAGYYNCASFYMIRKNDNISSIKLCTRQSKERPSEDENYNPVQNSYAALWDELRDIQSTIPALNVMRRILEYYFLQLCGYEGSDIRELVLEKEENRKMFIKQIEGQKPDMTDYQLASSLLAYINNPNGISDGLNYVEDCDDVEAYKRVFKMIFEALHQSQHYEMMTGKAVMSKK